MVKDALSRKHVLGRPGYGERKSIKASIGSSFSGPSEMEPSFFLNKKKKIHLIY